MTWFYFFLFANPTIVHSLLKKKKKKDVQLYSLSECIIISFVYLWPCQINLFKRRNKSVSHWGSLCFCFDCMQRIRFSKWKRRKCVIIAKDQRLFRVLNRPLSIYLQSSHKKMHGNAEMNQLSWKCWWYPKIESFF